ncbi:hypothetical protein LAZ67_3004961 [Cordylochernes scorpioides]|uniref:Uncharacterized protein n=1 Tax=Cordylochernes scorpioides TaxID=51811 RepID=A0ABY6K9Y7_9ARAC|nr:hypothetical protein LAZ67_3004961 [Cordylochernes scorpioides]
MAPDSFKSSTPPVSARNLRKRRRPVMSWLEVVKEAIGRSVDELRVVVTNGLNWRIFIHIVTRSRTRLNE